MRQYIHTMSLQPGVRFLAAPPPTRPTRLSHHPLHVPPSPPLSPRRKNQTQHEQQAQRNPNPHPDGSRIRIRMSGGFRSHRGDCGSGTRADGIVDRCGRRQLRGRIRLSENIAERRVAAAGPWPRAAEYLVEETRIATGNSCNCCGDGDYMDRISNQLERMLLEPRCAASFSFQCFLTSTERTKSDSLSKHSLAQLSEFHDLSVQAPR